MPRLHLRAGVPAEPYRRFQYLYVEDADLDIGDYVLYDSQTGVYISKITHFSKGGGPVPNEPEFVTTNEHNTGKQIIDELVPAEAELVNNIAYTLNEEDVSELLSRYNAPSVPALIYRLAGEIGESPNSSPNLSEPDLPNPNDGGGGGDGGGGDGGGDGFGSDGSIDATGDLLTNLYSGRDAIRSAAKDTVRVTIVLFGVVLAGLSLFQDGTDPSMEASPTLLMGLSMLGGALLFSAGVLVRTASYPRPNQQLSKTHRNKNKSIFAADESDSSEEDLGELSEKYFQTIEDLDKKNTKLGLVIAAAVGLAVLGTGWIGYDMLAQLAVSSLAEPQFRMIGLSIIFVATVVVTTIAVCPAYAQQNGWDDRDACGSENNSRD